MKPKCMNLLLALSIPVLCCCCDPPEKKPEDSSAKPKAEASPPVEVSHFSFSSGGSHHISGYGEWSVRMGADRSFAVKHNVRGKIREFGPFKLSADQRSKMWELLEKAKIRELKPSTRSRVPDEDEYAFGLVMTDKASFSKKLLWNDAHKLPDVVKLREYIYKMIREYTGEEMFK